MKAKKNSGMFKFPIDIKGDFDLPDFEGSDNFTLPDLKDKISSEVKELSTERNKRKKCQSSKLL